MNARKTKALRRVVREAVKSAENSTGVPVEPVEYQDLVHHRTRIIDNPHYEKQLEDFILGRTDQEPPRKIRARVESIQRVISGGARALYHTLKKQAKLQGFA